MRQDRARINTPGQHPGAAATESCLARRFTRRAAAPCYRRLIKRGNAISATLGSASAPPISGPDSDWGCGSALGPAQSGFSDPPFGRPEWTACGSDHSAAGLVSPWCLSSMVRPDASKRSLAQSTCPACEPSCLSSAIKNLPSETDRSSQPRMQFLAAILKKIQAGARQQRAPARERTVQSGAAPRHSPATSGPPT